MKQNNINEKIITKFLWLPLTINNKTKWFKTASFKQIEIKQPSSDKTITFNTSWYEPNKEYHYITK